MESSSKSCQKSDQVFSPKDGVHAAGCLIFNHSGLTGVGETFTDFHLSQKRLKLSRLEILTATFKRQAKNHSGKKVKMESAKRHR